MQSSKYLIILCITTSWVLSSFSQTNKRNRQEFTLQNIPDSLCYRFGKENYDPDKMIGAILDYREFKKYTELGKVYKDIANVQTFKNIRLLKIIGPNEEGFPRILIQKFSNLIEYESNISVGVYEKKELNQFFKQNPDLKVLRFFTYTDSIPSGLTSLKRLEALEIHYNKPSIYFPFYLPKGMSNLVNLQSLSLDADGAVFESDQEFWTLPKLINLSIWNAKSVNIHSLPSLLQRLELYRIKHLELGNSCFSNSRSIQFLRIAGIEEKSEINTSFEELTQLIGMELDIKHNIETFPDFNRFQQLTYLNLNVGVKDRQAFDKIRLPQLEYFNFNDDSQLEYTEFPLEITPNLKYISITSMYLQRLPEEILTSNQIQYVHASSLSFDFKESAKLSKSNVRYLDIPQPTDNSKESKEIREALYKKIVPEGYIPPPVQQFKNQFLF